jgi:3-oxoacid CoA-transferase A subunit
MKRSEIFQTPAEAVADFHDGASLMIGGFAGAGSPLNLMNALYYQGAKDLTTVSNGVGFPSPRDDTMGLGDLVSEGRVRKVIAAFTASTRPSRVGTAEERVQDGSLEAELTPQGTLAERIRAGGAGIPAFFTPAGAETLLAEGKEQRTFDGRIHVLESALFADYAFIRAWKADEAGNLIYRRSARNFNPIMAMAAACTIVEVEEPIVPAGGLDPDHIHTPSLYVERLVRIPEDGIIHLDRAERLRAREATGRPPDPTARSAPNA